MANSNWILSLLAGAVAGAAGGLLAGTLMTEPPRTSEMGPYEAANLAPAVAAGERQLPDSAAAFDAVPTDLGPLAGRVAERERELALLRGQVAGRRRLDPQESVASFDPDQLEPILDQAMGAFLDEREAEAAEARRARDEQRRQARMTRQMERWTEELGLTDIQAADMQTILTESETRRRDYFNGVRESGSFDRQAIGDYMSRSREELDVSLGGILSMSQLATYQESNSSSMFGGWGGGRSGGDRGAGSGGRGGGF